MRSPTYPLIGLVLVLGVAHVDSAAVAQTAAAADPVAQALTTPVVGSDVVLEQVRRFIEARIPRMPTVKSAEQWQRTAGQIRRDMLAKVVLRGEAAHWNEAATNVEWLDTIPGGPGYNIRKLRFEAVPGMWVPALLYMPDKLEGRAPAVLNVNGHDPLGKSAGYKQIRCINQAKRGMIAMNVEWLGMGQLRGDGFVHYCAAQLDLCGTSAVAPFYLSMKRSLDILLSLPEVDPDRIAVTGLSGGGWQTIFISSLDERVTLADPVAGYSSFLTRARYPSDLGDTEQTPCDMATVADYAHLTAMRAPRPTLLTFNSKDNCCFASGHALQPLVDAAKPMFALFGQEANLRWHVNDNPGTHNFEQDNREALCKMMGDHFYAGKPFDWHEIACQDEIKTAEQLSVPLPEKNEDFNTLARKLMRDLPTRSASDGLTSELATPRNRDQLRTIVYFKPYDVAATSGKNPQVLAGNVQVRQYTFKLGSDWTVPATEFRPASATGTAILIGDKGRASLASHVRRLLDNGRAVLAVDPFYFGASTIPQRDSLYAILVAGAGERPLGIQAGQVASIARWLKKQNDSTHVELVAIGPRTSMIALVAAACEPEAFGSVELHDPLPSLKQLIEKNERVDNYPELFCFGLLQSFDIKDIAAMIAPRPVRTVRVSTRP